MFCFRQQLFYSTELNSTSEIKSCLCRAAVELQSSQLSAAVVRRLKQALFTRWLALTIYRATKRRGTYPQRQGSFLHEHARPLNKRCAWRLTTGSAFIKMARLKAIVGNIFLVGLGECARDLIKCVVCKKNCNMVLTKAK